MKNPSNEMMSMFMDLDKNGFGLLITDEGWEKLLELDANVDGSDANVQGVDKI